MHELARRPDRGDLFRATAQKMGIHEAIIEKDFWVCWTLDYLFHESPWKDSLAFKGGTSLSKAYGLIQRFSEDIDLIIDWTLLGYGAGTPWETRSSTQQDTFNKKVNQKASEFLLEELVPALHRDFSIRLEQEVVVLLDDQNVLFQYPKIFSLDAIQPQIRLETGPLAAWVPNEQRIIRPYSAEHFPGLFTYSSTSVRTVVAERTFWEKATILHQEAYRGAGKPFPSRYSRHYYDLYRMINAPIKDVALSNLTLLNEVVEFKMRFYRCPWALYEDAKPGTLRLMPPASREQELRSDYAKMRSMLFGEIPSFDAILSGIASLESEINALEDLSC